MNAPKQKGLGKGLSALMGEQAPAPTSPAAVPPAPAPTASGQPAAAAQQELMITALRPGKYQPRTNFRLEQLQELADSIAHNGIMQPILVRPLAQDGQYEIVAGERRWRAAKIAGLSTVPVLVRELTDKVALELAIVENIQRADLSPIEEAAGYQRLMDEFGYTQEELAETVGKSRSHVANLLRMLGLPEEIRDMLDRGDLSMGHARTLIGHDDALQLAEEIIQKGLSVRQTEALVRRDPNKPMGRPRKSAMAMQNMRFSGGAGQGGDKDSDIIALENTLSENLGMRVSIDGMGSNGIISLQYDSLEQLDDILRRLGGSF